MGSKNYKFVEKIINILLNILIFVFCIILLISIYTGVQTKILGNKYTNFFGYSIFEVQTGSMGDSIRVGDWIIVKLTQDVKLNDVITYRQNNDFITHRVIEVYNGTYVTKGDANNTKDDPIDQNQIVGKVDKVLGNLGILRKTLFNKAVLITFIITLLLFNYAIKKNKGSEKDKSDLKNINKLIDMLLIKVRKIFNNKKEINVISHKTEKSTIVEPINDIKEEVVVEEVIATKIIDDVKEEELGKTSVFRVISIDPSDLADKYKKEAQIIEEKKREEEREEELDKTSFFRVISVDTSEMNDTLLEIAKNEMNSKELKDKNDSKLKNQVIEEVEPDEEIEDVDTLTKISLDMIKNKSGRGKNIIDTSILIKKEELNEIISILIKEDKLRQNEATIKNTFMDTYIDSKYYNYYNDLYIDNSSRSTTLKIRKTINMLSSDLVNNYKGTNKNYPLLVDIYNNIFLAITNLEVAFASDLEISVRREYYRKELLKNYKEYGIEEIDKLTKEIVKVQRKYKAITDCFLKNLETNMFNLVIDKVTSRKNMFIANLEHNISFSKVYSDYVIDKTYTEGVVAEDKMTVELTLLSIQLIEDMKNACFNNNYVIYIPSSLYLKEKKLYKLLKLIDDKHAKNSVIILITFEDLILNKKLIKELKKEGYKFATVFLKDTVVKDKNRSSILLVDYIFIDKKNVDINTMLPFIPTELVDNIISDQLVEKIIVSGGGQQ